MAEPFIGEIRLFGITYAPRGWADCNGQLLDIATNTALFSLLGTTYGGDGRTTFGLPDLRGRAPLHAGTGAGLTPRPLGSRGGEETTTLTVGNLPPHTHAGPVATDRTTNRPGGSAPAVGGHYGASADTTGAVGGSTGDGDAFDNMPPFTTVRFCIALVGIFPSRS